MSVVATLAPLDEAIGEIIFTVGERADGVVSQRNTSLYGHGREPIALGDVQLLANRLRNLLESHLPGVLTLWNTKRRPFSFRSS